MVNMKGNPNLKPGPGRPKGSKGRKTAREIMEEYNYNPIAELIDQARTTTLEMVRQAINRELATYYVPKIHSISLADLLKISADAPQVIKSIKIDYGNEQDEHDYGVDEDEDEDEDKEPTDHTGLIGDDVIE